jgi:microcystin-dependent protein
MSDPYIGEIRIFAGNFAPANWAFCQGQLIAISQNDALFNLIGTTYGGDGQNTFALPNLQGRVPVHQGTGSSGTNYVVGAAWGVESVTLNSTQMPQHTHAAMASTADATTDNPSNLVLASPPVINNVNYTYYFTQHATAPTILPMDATALSNTGSTIGHENRMPYLAVNYIIALFGIYPSQ